MSDRRNGRRSRGVAGGLHSPDRHVQGLFNARCLCHSDGNVGKTRSFRVRGVHRDDDRRGGAVARFALAAYACDAGGAGPGETFPLREIERRVVPTVPGSQYLGFDYDPQTNIYTLKFLRNGSVIWVDVDGRTGQDHPPRPVDKARIDRANGEETMRVLIVEDEPNLGQQLRNALEGRGLCGRSRAPMARTAISSARPRATTRSSSISACPRSTG